MSKVVEKWAVLTSFPSLLSLFGHFSTSFCHFLSLLTVLPEYMSTLGMYFSVRKARGKRAFRAFLGSRGYSYTRVNPTKLRKVARKCTFTCFSFTFSTLFGHFSTLLTAFRGSGPPGLQSRTRKVTSFRSLFWTFPLFSCRKVLSRGVFWAPLNDQK